MDVELTPKTAQKFYGSDGGSYYIWSSSDVPILSEAKVGAGKLVLAPLGLALPHYADAAKIGYVLQGQGIVGLVFQEGPKEKVVRLNQGDAIALNFGDVSWWYNDGDTEFVVVFLGESAKAYSPGQFTYSFLAGTNNILHGFSMEFLTRAWNLEKVQVTELLTSQTGQVIVKVKEGIHIPDPCESDHAKGIVFNFNTAPFDVDVKHGGRTMSLTSMNMPLLGETGLSAKLVKLDANAMFSPGFSTDSSVQVIYIVRGSGRVEIVGVDGSRALEAKVTAGSLFVVPRLFVVAQIADGEGMEWFSIITNPQPSFSHFGGKTSVLNALSPQLLEAAFNVTPDLVKLFKVKGSKDVIFFPPPN
ncbi:glutelin type-A 1-like protein [Cinnamomum micranthum f. kanehirae]|uniref:Glutelin type-A 1-like protein n=1 Tax=Cinnamomum micranthum f. kanehirae TaxID=337451 RepID=A0A3S3P441_9MAGN|nr:glutelin type-A 1-like protein [Cinnamomum micranthum f. kanehirae]